MKTPERGLLNNPAISTDRAIALMEQSKANRKRSQRQLDNAFPGKLYVPKRRRRLDMSRFGP